MQTRIFAALALTFLGAFNSQLISARAQSPFGNALSLDGVSQYVTVPTAAGSAVNSPLTIEAWVYVRAYASWSRLMDFGNGAGVNNIVCVLSSDTSQPALYFFNGASAIIGSLTSPSPLPLNAWTHLAFTYDGTNGSIFINGNLATNGPMATPPSATRTNNFIGRSNFSDPYANVILDEFRIWSVARSPAQIQASLGAPLVGNEAGLLLYYKFDSSSGTVATNSATATGPDYNGTLVNGPEWVPGPQPPSYLVTSTSDAGPGSLRGAISAALNGGFIYFDTNLSGQTITLTSGELLLNQNLTIDASSLAGGIAISGNNSSRIFHVSSGSANVLTGLTITNGHVVIGAPVIDDGGGILNQGTLTLNRCTLSGNYGNGSGGGVENNGTLTVNSSTLSGNIAYYTEGGGIRNLGMLTVNQSTFSGNTANYGDGGGLASEAGATAIVNLSTFAGNTADYSGGGIVNRGVLTVNSSTLSGNVANGPGSSWGGGGIQNNLTCTLNNCIVAGNTNYYYPNIDGTFTSTGTNLTSGDPLLAPLGNYGGPTPTMLPLPGSPAIDAGSDTVTNMFATDQRGFPRLFGAHVDIGADEFGAGDSAPFIASLSTGSVTHGPPTYLGSLTVGASVNPNAIDAPATVWVQYGVSSLYGLATTPLALSPGTSFVPLTQPLTNLAPSLTWHYRWVATNYLGTTFSPDQTFNVGTPGANVLSGVLGDANGDGIVSQAELDAVYANYVTNSPWLYMTNVAGLGGTNVTFSLSNSVLGAYSIQYSTDLLNWVYLGPATPRYLFTDTNAPAVPQRFYRLTYP